MPCPICAGARWSVAGGVLLWSLALAAPAWAQTLGQDVDDGISLWRVFASLLLCAGLALGGALVLRARQSGGPLRILKKQPRLRLIETLRLNPQATLHIVECDGEEMLVSAAAEGVVVLSKLDPGRAETTAVVGQTGNR